MAKNFTEIAYSDAVLAMQRKYNAIEVNTELQHSVGRNSITPALATYLGSRVSFYMATASKAGQPYIQHRGGPPGFLKILDPQTLAFADFEGNKQYISIGNLSENPRTQLFFMDYSQRRRLKIWGTAKVVEDDPKLLTAVTPEAWRKPLHRAIRITVDAWDVNCPAYIPQLFSIDDMEAAHAGMLKHIDELEAEIERLKAATTTPPAAKLAAAKSRTKKR